MYSFKVRKTGTGSPEVHVLDGKSGYRAFALQTGIPDVLDTRNAPMLADVNRDGVPDMVDLSYDTFPDDVQSQPAVLALGGVSNYQQKILRAQRPAIEPPDAVSYFARISAGDYNRDGNVDLFFVKNRSTSSGRMEVHILRG